jgi:hypothetical protein
MYDKEPGIGHLGSFKWGWMDIPTVHVFDQTGVRDATSGDPTQHEPKDAGLAGAQ